jgi:hypothetical protein
MTGPPPLDDVAGIARVADPLDWTPEKTRMMVAACRTMARYHRERCPEIAALYARRRFDPDAIRCEEDLAAIPPLGVTAMKHFLLLSHPEDEAVLHLTSSGTGGQKTQVLFDAASLDRVQAMMEGLWLQEGLVSREPASYVMFAYDPDEAKDLGIAFTNKNLQRFAPVADSFYAIRRDGETAWAFRARETLERLDALAAARPPRPVRLLGMPAFIHELLAGLPGGFSIRLPAGSLMVTGGGWKAAEDRRVSREEFREAVTAHLGIPGDRVRDNYGLAEHSAPYIECPEHRFHVPVFNRVLVRDPVTLDVLPPGDVGLLELITPFNSMMPTLALLTTDLACVERAACGCGRRSPTFVLVGRGGITKHKGCAITAGEIVRRGAAPGR